MYRSGGIREALPVAADFAADRKTGYLVRVNEEGQATDQLGEDNLLFFPLVDDFVKADNKDVAVQVNGIAKIYVEAASGIVAGAELGVGTTGKGVAAYSSGTRIGKALAKPAGNGDFIPVLLAPFTPEGSY